MLHPDTRVLSLEQTRPYLQADKLIQEWQKSGLEVSAMTETNKARIHDLAIKVDIAELNRRYETLTSDLFDPQLDNLNQLLASNPGYRARAGPNKDKSTTSQPRKPGQSDKPNKPSKGCKREHPEPPPPPQPQAPPPPELTAEHEPEPEPEPESESESEPNKAFSQPRKRGRKKDLSSSRAPDRPRKVNRASPPPP